MCVTEILTILLVEPPQLDLVGFMLSLLLQSAGPGNGGKQSTVILWNRKLCASIPVLHMIPLLSRLARTASSWRAMRRGCISKLWGRLTENLPHLLPHSSKCHLTPQVRGDMAGLVSEYVELKNGSREWINQCMLNINASHGDYSLQRAENSTLPAAVTQLNEWPVMLDRGLLLGFSACWNVRLCLSQVFLFPPQSLPVQGGCRRSYNN